MASERPPIGPSIIPTPALRTAASPIDTFVPPTRGGRLAQLAQGLAELAPSLQSLANVLTQHQARQAGEEGAEIARRLIAQLDIERRLNAQAVQEGRLPANENPFLLYGFDVEVGKLMASRLENELRLASDAVPSIREGTDVDAYRDFVAEFEQKFLDDNVPEEMRGRGFRDGYSRLRDAALSNLERNWSAAAGARFQDDTLGLFLRNQEEAVRAGLSAGLSLDEIGRGLRDNMDAKAALMPTPEFRQAVNRTTVNAVALAALTLSVESGRNRIDLYDDLLAVLPSGRPGAEAPLGNTQYAKLVRNIEFGPGPGEGSLQSKIRSGLTERFKFEETENEQAGVAAVQRVHEMFSPGFDAAEGRMLPDFRLSEENKQEFDRLRRDLIARGNTKAVKDIDAIRDSYQNAEYVDDESLVASLRVAIASNDPDVERRILDALRTKRLTHETYQRLTDLRISTGQRNVLAGDSDFKFLIDRFRFAIGFDPETIQNPDRWRIVSERFEMDEDRFRLRVLDLERQLTQWYVERFLPPGIGKQRNADQIREELSEWVRFTVSQLTSPEKINNPAMGDRTPDPDRRLTPTNLPVTPP